MEKFEIEKLGTAGLNTDLSPWELPENFITYGINFRVDGDHFVTTSAFELWSAPAVSFNAGHVLAVEVSVGDFWLVAGRTAVQTFNGTNWFDISNPNGYAGLGVNDELSWTSCMLGSIPIINNPQAYPEYWSPVDTANPMQSLNFSPGNTWEDVGKSFEVIRSHNNFLFALNLTESGVQLPNSYRWSNPADTNGLPFTWDETDPSTVASIEQILGDAGPIVDGLTLRNSFCIYSERGVNILEQSGDEFVFRNRELSTTYGLLNRNSLVEVKGVHYFIADGDILMNDGNSIRSIVYNRIRKQFNSSMNGKYFRRSFAVLNNVEKEVLFCIPSGTSEYPDQAFIYNWVADNWSVKDLPANTAYADYGSIVTSQLSWNTLVGTYASQTSTYNSDTTTPLNRSVVTVDATTSGLVIVSPNQSSGLDNTNSTVERTDIPLHGVDTITTMTRIYPHMTGFSDVNIQVGSQDYPGGPVTWSDAQVFNPSTDRKLDVRTTGALHTWRVESIGSSVWRLSGFTIEYAPAGKR